jgi:hypothetical protein
MARVKASLLASAFRGLDPRHTLPDLGHLSERRAGDATWHNASDGKLRNAHLAVVDRGKGFQHLSGASGNESPVIGMMSS